MKANILGATMRDIPQIPAYERMKNTDGSPAARAASLLFLLWNGEIGKDGYPSRQFSKHYLQKTLYFPA